MDPISSASAVTSTAVSAGTVQTAAGISVMKKAAHLQADAVAQLLQALPQPALATTGTLGTQVDTYA